VSSALKFARAQTHLADLQSQVRAFLAAIADDLAEPATAQDGSIEYRRRDLPPPPVEIALTFGDFLQTARASLDHAVYAISTAVRPGFGMTGFPIVLSPEAFEEAKRKYLPFVPEETLEAIRGLQPFVSGIGDRDFLWQLHDLARTDRHRTITLLTAVVEAESVGWTRTEPSDEYPDIHLYRPAVAAGELLVRLPSPEQEPSARFTPDFQARVVIGEGDRSTERPDVIGLATEIRGRVWLARNAIDPAAGSASQGQSN